jgi:hypothetical protein
MPVPNTQTDCLHLVRQFNYGHTQRFIDHWGEVGDRGKGLIFLPSGLMRLGQVLGWIEGLHDKAPITAAKLAEHFIGKLDYLANYGPKPETKTAPPPYLVELGDDGIFGSFTLLWYKPEVPHPVLASKGRHTRQGLGPAVNYVPDFNGGLIFHGVGNTFTIDLSRSDNPWSIHT